MGTQLTLDRPHEHSLPRSCRFRRPRHHYRSQLRRRLCAQRGGPGRLLGRDRQANRLDKALHAGERYELRARRLPHSLVCRWPTERFHQLPGPPIGSPPQHRRHHLGRRRPQRQPCHYLWRTVRTGEPLCRRVTATRRKEGRPRHPLPTHDSRSGGGHAGLHPHWCRAQHRVRRLLTRIAHQPYC